MANIKDHVSIISGDQNLLPGGDGQDFWPPHAPTHEDDGSDVINVNNLLGTLADPQNAGWVQGIAVPADTVTPNEGDTLIYSQGTGEWVYGPPTPGASIWARDNGSGFIYPTTSTDELRMGDGDAGTPAYAFLSAGDSGLFWDGRPALSLAGLKVWQFEHLSNVLTMTSNYRTRIVAQHNGAIAGSAAVAELAALSTSSGDNAQATVYAEHTSGWGRVDIHAISGGLSSATVDIWANADSPGQDTNSYITLGGQASGMGLRYLRLGGLVGESSMLFDSIRFGTRSLESTPAWTQSYLEFCEPGNTTQWTDYRNLFGELPLIQAVNVNRAESVWSIQADGEPGGLLAGDLKLYAGANFYISQALDGFVLNAITNEEEYVPVTVTLDSGTYLNGSVASVRVAHDGNTYDVQEVSGIPGFSFIFDYQNVESINRFRYYYNYEGGPSHEVYVQLYNWGLSQWVNVGSFVGPGLGGDLRFLDLKVRDGASYIDGSGNARMRVYHVTTGSPSHVIKSDFASLVSGFAGVSTGLGTLQQTYDEGLPGVGGTIELSGNGPITIKTLDPSLTASRTLSLSCGVSDSTAAMLNLSTTATSGWAIDLNGDGGDHTQSGLGYKISAQGNVSILQEWSMGNQGFQITGDGTRMWSTQGGETNWNSYIQIDGMDVDLYADQQMNIDTGSGNVSSFINIGGYGIQLEPTNYISVRAPISMTDTMYLADEALVSSFVHTVIATASTVSINPNGNNNEWLLDCNDQSSITVTLTEPLNSTYRYRMMVRIEQGDTTGTSTFNWATSGTANINWPGSSEEEINSGLSSVTYLMVLWDKGEWYLSTLGPWGVPV